MKDKFENHPVIFGITMFVMGLGFQQAAVKIFPGLAPVIAQEQNSKKLTSECRVDGLPAVAAIHQESVDSLKERILLLEDFAATTSLEDLKVSHIHSANRIRADIEKENENYLNVISRLNVICDKKQNELSKVDS